MILHGPRSVNALARNTAYRAPPNCNSYDEVFGSSEPYVCSSWMFGNGVSLQELTLVNPWINNNCSAIYENLKVGECRSICIGVSASPSSITAPPAGTPTDTASDYNEDRTVSDKDSNGTQA